MNGETDISDDKIRALLNARRIGQFPPTETEPTEIPNENAEEEREEEYNFRKGYHYGWLSAVELVFELYRKGYARPNEIGNILSDFSNQIQRWRSEVFTESPLDRHHTPTLKAESWSNIRAKVFARDGHECAFCGSISDLEIDHIEPVREGGTPALDNLRVLCAACNVGRNAKQPASFAYLPPGGNPLFSNELQLGPRQRVTRL